MAPKADEGVLNVGKRITTISAHYQWGGGSLESSIGEGIVMDGGK